MFPFVPLGEVDPSAVVGVEDFAAFGRVVAQGLQLEALKGTHVVLSFALGVGQVGERLGA